MGRPDGKRIKNADPMYTVAAYIMKHRTDSMNMITVDVPVDPMNAYIQKKHKEDGRMITHLAIFVSAFLRTACEYPALNRFVVNKRIYTRNEFSIGMVVLKTDDPGVGTMSKVRFEMEDTIFDVQRKLDAYIQENRTSETDNGTEKLIKILLRIPGLCSFGVGLFKFLDKYGLLPKKIIDMSPFHETMVITNLASIRTNHIYHHIYEFGTVSLMTAMGNLRVVPKMKGTDVVFERCLPLGIVMDERICSGSYFSSVFRKLSSYMKDPAKLEVPPEVVIKDEI